MALSAALMAVAQSYSFGPWLVFFGLVPLFLALPIRGFGATWLWLALFSGLYTAGTAHWIRLTGTGFGWFLAAAILYQMAWAAVPAAGAWLGARCRFDSGSLLWLAVLWTLSEILSRRVLFGTSWALLGLPLTEVTPLAQLASVGAPEALSFLVVAVNVAIAMTIRRSRPRERGLALAEAGGLLAAAMVFGLFRLAAEPKPATARIGLVQPVISQEIRWDRPENRPPLLAVMNRLIDRAAADSPALIVLPEGALPGLVRYEGDLAGFSTGAVERTGIPLLFGSIDQDDQERLYNVAVRIGIDGSVDRYRKRRLVPFAEHTPWPFRYTPADGWVQFSPGFGQSQMPLEGGKSFAVMLCLEDTYPDLAREYARAGADFLVSMVNTENFRDTNQGLAHLRRARLTAIASGLPMLRAANSGLSGSIDSQGRILHLLPPNREQGATIDVSVVRSGTVYQSLGDGGVFLILLVISAVRLVWPRMRIEPKIRPRRQGQRRRRSAQTASPVRAG